MSRRILITGATTAAGTRLVERLSSHGDVEHVLAVGIESPGTAPIVESDTVSYAQVDLTRRRRLWRLIFGTARELGIDTVVHTATHRSARRMGRSAHRLNVETTLELLSECERHPTIERFVYRSFYQVYAIDADRPDIMDERHPLNLSSGVPQWIRDRVEADLSVCSRMGLSPLSIAVLRCAECLADGSGSQLYDYLRSGVCFMPAGFDPMVNVLSVDDLVNALALTAMGDVTGVFNIPGKDTLPLSGLIERAGRVRVQIPGPLMGPLYWARQVTRDTDFDYKVNRWRFHYNAILDGSRAEQELGYTPEQSALDSLMAELQKNPLGDGD